MSTHIPFDIQVQIIERFPVKSLIRFRSVCKAWKSFIDSSHFIAGYSHTQQMQHLLINYEVGDWPATEVKFVDFVDDDDTFPQQKFVPTLPPLLQLIHGSRVLGSSGGLLFLRGYFREPDNSAKHMIVLWNPAIRKSIAVALPNLVLGGSNAVFGFGVCPDTNDPKLVRITYMDGYCQVMVFTLSSGEWTCLSTNHLPRNSIAFTGFSIVVGRFIYWLAYDRIDVDGEECRNLIMSFDMRTEKFREIDLPDCLANVPEDNMSFCRLRESLVLLDYSENTIYEHDCDVWMMEHGAFTKLFTINPPNGSVSRTVGFTKSGEPIVEMFDNDKASTPSALVVYEPCSQHIKDLGIHGDRFCVDSYTESLLLLDHDDGHIVRCGDVKR